MHTELHTELLLVLLLPLTVADVAASVVVSYCLSAFDHHGKNITASWLLFLTVFGYVLTPVKCWTEEHLLEGAIRIIPHTCRTAWKVARSAGLPGMVQHHGASYWSVRRKP